MVKCSNVILIRLKCVIVFVVYEKLIIFNKLILGLLFWVKFVYIDVLLIWIKLFYDVRNVCLIIDLVSVGIRISGL